ncbi:MAG TPA: hypothetical protein DCM68_07885 [Verrucomicrobia bacterium]|nr:hypothetical protein [Verrucomicrobiota bacterium]
MDEVKWAWVLFLAATLALLIRLAMWFLPAPVWRHSENVSRAAESASAPAPAEVSAPAAPTAPAAGPVWPDEALERGDWPPPAPEEPRPEPRPAAAGPVPPPEEFHLRRTRWGMTIDEVRAAEEGEPLREGERGLMYATTTLDWPCLLTYSFAEGRLVRARLAFSDPAGQHIPPLSVAQAQRRFLSLREQLRRRYGEPVEKTVHLPRDISDLQRRAAKQEELAKQYDAEIAEAEARLKAQREALARRFARWNHPAEMIARTLAPQERDLKDLRQWKQEALARAAQSRKGIQDHQAADAARPLVATMTARWPYAREIHDIELRLDFRAAVPRLDIRYEGSPALPGIWRMDEL